MGMLILHIWRQPCFVVFVAMIMCITTASTLPIVTVHTTRLTTQTAVQILQIAT